MYGCISMCVDMYVPDVSSGGSGHQSDSCRSLESQLEACAPWPTAAPSLSRDRTAAASESLPTAGDALRLVQEAERTWKYTNSIDA